MQAFESHTGTCFDTVGRAESRRKAYELKFAESRPYADADVPARKLVEIASTIEPVQNGRIYIERINAPLLEAGGAIAKGWLIRHESRT